MKHILFILFFMVCGIKAFSQETEIQKIRKRYQEVQEQIKNRNENSGIYTDLISLNNENSGNYPGVGNYFYKVRFYYEMFGGDKIPVKIEVESGIAARTFTAEYLFEKIDDLGADGKVVTSPALIFSFTNDPSSGDCRLYFNQGKLLRVLFGQKASDVSQQKTRAQKEIKSAKAWQEYQRNLLNIPE